MKYNGGYAKFDSVFTFGVSYSNDFSFLHRKLRLTVFISSTLLGLLFAKCRIILISFLRLRHNNKAQEKLKHQTQTVKYNVYRAA